MDPPGGGTQRARIVQLLHKALTIAYIVLTLEFGIVLVSLPWKDFWDRNYLLHLYPQFTPLIANPFFKGFVVGLGIINILIGIQEFVRLEISKKPFSLR